MSNRKRGILALYFSVFLLSLNGFFAKAIELDLLSIIGLRSIIAASGIAIVLAAMSGRIIKPSLRELLVVVVLGILLGGHWLSYFYSMRVSTVAVGMLCLFCYPLMSVFIEPLFTKVPIKKTDLMSACIVLLGMVILVSESFFSAHHILEGALWGVLSALMFSMRNTMQKYWVHNLDSGSLIFYQTVVITLILGSFVKVETLGAVTWSGWGALVLLGLLSTAGAHVLLSISFKTLSVTTVGLISCLTPLLGSAIAWFAFSETPSWRIFLGGSMILVVAAYQTYAHK